MYYKKSEARCQKPVAHSEESVKKRALHQRNHHDAGWTPLSPGVGCCDIPGSICTSVDARHIHQRSWSTHDDGPCEGQARLPPSWLGETGLPRPWRLRVVRHLWLRRRVRDGPVRIEGEGMVVDRMHKVHGGVGKNWSGCWVRDHMTYPTWFIVSTVPILKIETQENAHVVICKLSCERTHTFCSTSRRKLNKARD